MDGCDIPLKPPQETFVDEPSSLDDVNIDELAFDLEHNIKDINKLNVFHAIAIFNSCLTDLIKLQADESLFREFRKQQLERFHVDIDAIQNDTVNGHRRALKLSSEKQCSPSVSPPLKFARLQNNFEEADGFMKDRTPDSLFNNDNDQETDGFSHEFDSNGEPHFIPIEDAVQNCTMEKVQNPITSQNPSRLREEIVYNIDNNINKQNTHLLKSFNLVKIPSLSIEQFLVRIKTYSSYTSVLVYIHSAFLIFKLCVLLDIVQLTEYNVHRFILALIRCLTKNLEDVYQKQKSFATVGGVNVKDLFKIEVGFLYLCNFKLVTGEEILNTYLKEEFTQMRKFCKEKLSKPGNDNSNKKLEIRIEEVQNNVTGDNCTIATS